MPALISAELLRLRTLRSPRYAALGLLAFVAITAASNLRPSAETPMSPAELADALRLFALMGVVAVGALAANNLGAEFKSGSIAMTYLSHPQRERVNAARALTYAGLGFIFGGLAAGVVLTVSAPVADAGSLELSLSATDVLRMIGGAAAGGAFAGAVGALLGMATRSPVVASSAFFGWYVVEFTVIPAGIRPHMPFTLVESLMGGPDTVPVAAAIGLLLAYLAAVALCVRQWALPRDLT